MHNPEWLSRLASEGFKANRNCSAQLNLEMKKLYRVVTFRFEGGKFLKTIIDDTDHHGKPMSFVEVFETAALAALDNSRPRLLAFEIGEQTEIRPSRLDKIMNTNTNINPEVETLDSLLADEAKALADVLDCNDVLAKAKKAQIAALDRLGRAIADRNNFQNAR